MFFAVREGDLAKADSLNHLEAGGAYYTVVFQLVRAYKERDEVAQQKLWPLYLQQLRKSKSPLLMAGPSFVSLVLIAAGDIDGAEQALAVAADSAKLPPQRMAVGMAKVTIEAERGRPGAAAAAIPPQLRGQIDHWGLLLFDPFRHPPRNELLRFRDAVLHSDSVGSESGRAVLVAQLRLYWSALANCQLGDVPQALQQAHQMESLAAPDYWREAVRALATDVRAFADVARGDDAGALRRIESIPIDVPIDLNNTAADRKVETLWRGELLYRVGRYDEALQWFENAVVPGPGFEVTPFYLLRRAQIHDRRGDTKQAARLYAQFLDYWKNPEPELQPFVREARGRLAAIQHKVD